MRTARLTRRSRGLIASLASAAALAVLAAGCTGISADDAPTAGTDRPAATSSPAKDPAPSADPTSAEPIDKAPTNEKPADEKPASDAGKGKGAGTDGAGVGTGTGKGSGTGKDKPVDKPKDEPKDEGKDEGKDKPEDEGKDPGKSHDHGSDKGDKPVDKPKDKPAAKPADVVLSEVTIPASWNGTLLTDPAPRGGSGIDVYFYEGMFHGDMGMAMGTIRAEDVPNSMTMSALGDVNGEAFTPESCTGSTTANTADAITCVLKGEKGTVLNVSMRAVPTPYGHPGLVVRVTDKASAAFKLPAGTAFNGEGRMGTSLSSITEASAADALAQSIMTMWDHEGDGSMPFAKATCELRNGGQQAVCVATGSPDGKADGIYVGTVQPFFDGEVGMVFGRLPAN